MLHDDDLDRIERDVSLEVAEREERTVAAGAASTAAIHRVVGLTVAEYAQRLEDGGSVAGLLDPRMHTHPILGIHAHAHGPTVEAARTPHTHLPTLTWDTTPIPLDGYTE